MVEPRHNFKMTAVAAAISAILLAHSAHQPEVCFVEKYDCPEPEQKLADEESHGRPSGPTGPSATSNTTTGPTGPGPRNITGTGALNATASIIEGSDGASGSDNTFFMPGTAAMNFASAAPQTYEDIQPRIFPSVG
jgi:hypothetical protein